MRQPNTTPARAWAARWIAAALLCITAPALAQDAPPPAPPQDAPPAADPAPPAPTPPADPAPAVAPASPCQDQVLALADRASLGLRTLFGRLNPEQQRSVMAWADCAAPDRGLVTVYEYAVRAHDSAPDARLYISPSQAVAVLDPDGAFPRRELADLVSGVPAARPFAARALAGADGALTFRGTLADLNARTHALEADLALRELKLRDAAPDGAELSASFLMANAYIRRAKEQHPLVFGRLATNAETVDAFGLLWRRAEETLARADRSAASAEMLKAAHGHLPTLKDLFAQAGVRAPAPDLTLEAAAAAPAPLAEAKSAEAKPAEAKPAEVKPAEAKQTVEKTEGAKPTEAAPAEVKPTEPASLPLHEQPGFQARMVALGVVLLGPWLWLAVLWGLKRRREGTFLRAANRSMAIATLSLVLTCLALVFLTVIGQGAALISWDGGFALAPLYFFVVLLLMLRRLDREERLASRQLMRKWARWGGLGLAVIVIGNLIVLITASFLVQYVMPPSFALVGVLASVFLVKLWRTGDQQLDPATPPKDQAAPPEPTKPEPAKPAPPKPEPAKPVAEPAKPAPKAQEPAPAPTKPAPEAAPPAPAPKPSAIPDDFADWEDSAPDESGISDEDFARELDALGGDEEDDPGAVPDDRAELYKLLGKK